MIYFPCLSTNSDKQINSIHDSTVYTVPTERKVSEPTDLSKQSTIYQQFFRICKRFDMIKLIIFILRYLYLVICQNSRLATASPYFHSPLLKLDEILKDSTEMEKDFYLQFVQQLVYAFN